MTNQLPLEDRIRQAMSNYTEAKAVYTWAESITDSRKPTKISNDLIESWGKLDSLLKLVEKYE